MREKCIRYSGTPGIFACNRCSSFVFMVLKINAPCVKFVGLPYNLRCTTYYLFHLRQVTRSSRYPLLIDPQGQALNWIRRHEKDRLPASGVTSFSSDRLRETLEYCMMEGKALIIAGVEEDIDPMLTPVLEKQVRRRDQHTVSSP